MGCFGTAEAVGWRFAWPRKSSEEIAEPEAVPEVEEKGYKKVAALQSRERVE